MPTPLDQRKLDALRAEADRFIAELDEEAYLHFAGLKETYDLVPIYERHAQLTMPDTPTAIGPTPNRRPHARRPRRAPCEAPPATSWTAASGSRRPATPQPPLIAQVSGTLNVAGLTAPVRIVRDTWGVPHLYAESQADLFLAQGFVQAQDRLFQREL